MRLIIFLIIISIGLYIYNKNKKETFINVINKGFKDFQKLNEITARNILKCDLHTSNMKIPKTKQVLK